MRLFQARMDTRVDWYAPLLARWPAFDAACPATTAICVVERRVPQKKSKQNMPSSATTIELMTAAETISLHHSNDVGNSHDNSDVVCYGNNTGNVSQPRRGRSYRYRLLCVSPALRNQLGFSHHAKALRTVKTSVADLNLCVGSVPTNSGGARIGRKRASTISFVGERTNS